jgi:hypothetical protein
MSELSVRRIVLALVPMTLAGVHLSASQLRPITVQDCVRTRRVVDQEVQISPDGSRVAYVVKAPDVGMTIVFMCAISCHAKTRRTAVYY